MNIEQQISSLYNRLRIALIRTFPNDISIIEMLLKNENIKQQLRLRVKYVNLIGIIKLFHNLNIYAPEVEQSILNHVNEISQNNDLDSAFAEIIFREIMTHAKLMQVEIFAQYKSQLANGLMNNLKILFIENIKALANEIPEKSDLLMALLNQNDVKEQLKIFRILIGNVTVNVVQTLSRIIVIARIKQQNGSNHLLSQGIFSGSAISRQMPIPQRVVYVLGPPGTFSEQAALIMFGNNVKYHYVDAIWEIFQRVSNDDNSVGLVPTFNSHSGLVVNAIDEFIETPLIINAELNLLIQQNLLARCSSQQITKIYSHAQSFKQCEQWLNMNYPNAIRIVVDSNSFAAKFAAHEENAAAIASSLCAQLYQLQIIAEDITRNNNVSTVNYTRFVVVGHQAIENGHNAKTFLLIKLDNDDKSSVNESIRESFNKRKLNISFNNIISNRNRAVNLILIDIDCKIDNPLFWEAIDEINKSGNVFVKILGSYSKDTKICEYTHHPKREVSTRNHVAKL